MFNKVFYISVITALIVITIGLFLPKNVHVERRVEIDRPAATVFALVNGFSWFPAWSPWSEKDPGILYQYEGPKAGTGAQLRWRGDPRLVGSGSQVITKSVPYSTVRMNMQVDQMGDAVSYFQIDRLAEGVSLTWGFDANVVEGHAFFSSLLNRYFALFFDRWIGPDYEQGLMRIKQLAETLPDSDFEDLEVDIINAEAMDILYVVAGTRFAEGNVAASLASAYREIMALMAEHSIERQSQPMAITRAWDAENYEFDAAIPVTRNDVPPRGNVRAGQSPSGRAIRAVHRGSYDRMGSTYRKLEAYLSAHGLEQGNVSWEHYISDPGQTPTDQTVTHIYYLLKDTSPQAD